MKFKDKLLNIFRLFHGNWKNKYLHKKQQSYPKDNYKRVFKRFFFKILMELN